MASSKLTAEERLIRKRQAARIRQQRCRARKRQALLERQKKAREAELATANVTGSEKVIARNSESNLVQIGSNYQVEHSPRSVFWNDIPRGNWVIPPRSPDFPHRYPSFEHKRRMYGPAAEHRSMYYRYPPSPPLLRPQVKHCTTHISNQFISTKLPTSRFYVYPDHESHTHEKEYGRLNGESESRRRGWVPPKLPMLQKSYVANKTKKEAIESKEEAAVDAILSLKSVKSEKTSTIVPPPKIQRLSTEPTSAFNEYHDPRPGPLRPGLYLTMRAK
mmetsp:Transcript_20145/g.30289  ORF Transcript_20145/g.30289 Transcript_20145/m.30289 type:complete len:276 (-) Transcript_20145:175-1002(-)|eukprot:CAMPEP_0178900582 /NCGR_PEP_ID=MMETSP0786-20121207/3550_1 /TAXON_ID=186022 /ORGANISM="Thalassionema frauenfeldii, Strain CCMP 1798" /LENGTH=275 /DNA_ID=CAMNT_0020571595 /DNA_START=129 /DNA_END=956 /DNA_ORIENTATION=-